MTNEMNSKKHPIALAFLMGCCVMASGQMNTVPAAPKPQQLAAAKSVFISNNSAGAGGGSDFLYDHFYAAVQQLNRFTIVLSPQEADLILEYSLHPAPGAPDPGGLNDLRILDPKTHIILWAVSEYEPFANRQSAVDKNRQAAMDRLAADLLRLTSPTK